jgi:RNA polymerase sigma factor (sigma-70 family)
VGHSNQQIPKWGNQGPPNQWRRENGTIDYETMLKNNEGLVLWAMKRFRLTQNSPELIGEYIQELRIHLCRTAEMYDPAKAKWGTYATTALFRYIMKIQRDKAKPKNSHSHLSVLKVEPNVLVSKRKHIPTVDEKDLLKYAVDKLDARKKEIVTKYYFEDMTYEQIGLFLKPTLTRERIRQILNEAIAEMRFSILTTGSL